MRAIERKYPQKAPPAEVFDYPEIPEEKNRINIKTKAQSTMVALVGSHSWLVTEFIKKTLISPV